MRARTLNASLICVVLLLSASGCQSSGTTLVRKGGARAAIVVAEGASEAVREAADNLAVYLRKMSGARLEVFSESEAPPMAAAIHIGRTRHVERLRLGLDELSGGECVIVSRVHNVALVGKTDATTVEAVYAFIEDVLGVKWYMPSELFEIVPRQDTVKVPDLELRISPDMFPRWFGGAGGEENRKWLLRNRVSGDGAPFRTFGHSLYGVYMPYREEHPEYFPLIGGKRRVLRSGEGLWQPCTSNPQVVQVAIEHYDRAFRGHPEGGYYRFGINDGRDWCECENCTKMDTPGRRTNSGYPDYSDRYYTYVKQVASGLAKKYPNHYLGLFAYFNVEMPPQSIEPLQPNVYVYLTQDTAQHHDPEYRKGDHDVVTGWTKRTDLLFKYEYYGLGWVPPRYFPHLVAEDVRFCKEAGVKGIYSELYPAWGSVLLAPYIAAHLWRDVDSDVDALVGEACSDLFGPAAGEMKRYLELHEQVIMKPRKGDWFEGNSYIREQTRLYEPEDVDRADRLLSEAMKKADTDLQRDRIEFIARWWRYAALHIRVYHLVQELHEAEVRSASGAKDLRATLARLKKAEAQKQKYHDRHIETDLLVNATWYKRSANTNYPHRHARWERTLQKAVDAAERKMDAWEAQGVR